jgi:hypothetical protein
MKEETAIKLLRTCAWSNLIGGVITALYLWANLSERIKPGHSVITETNPIDIITGFVYLILGASVFAFFLSVCSITESLIRIRENTKPAEKSRLFDS